MTKFHCCTVRKYNWSPQTHWKCLQSADAVNLPLWQNKTKLCKLLQLHFADISIKLWELTRIILDFVCLTKWKSRKINVLRPNKRNIFTWSAMERIGPILHTDAVAEASCTDSYQMMVFIFVWIWILSRLERAPRWPEGHGDMRKKTRYWSFVKTEPSRYRCVQCQLVYKEEKCVQLKYFIECSIKWR